MHHTYRCFGVFAAALFLAICPDPKVQSQTAPPPIESDIRMPRLFSDNMVLQEGASVPIWGWGEDGTTVTVKFRDQTVSTVVTNGKWMVQLRNLKPGGPETLTVTAGNKLEFGNVLVGEVWLAGGQSNMEFPLGHAFEATNDVAAVINPNIRLIKVPHTRLNEPTNDIGASWTESTPETAARFSAVAYFFARSLEGNLNVPVGIIESDWGGTPAEAWVEEGFLRANRDYQAEIIANWPVEEAHYRRALAAYREAKQAAADKGEEFKKLAPQRPWKPGELYNGMIAPLEPFAIKGALWYQGESNAGNERRAEQYHQLFPDLIRDWRTVWNEGSFPFLLVQLAPFHEIQLEPGPSAWALLREAQLLATETLPNVGMAVITDVGEQRNIHPTRKKPVGERLALAARAIAYHQPIEYSGPIYKSMKIHGDEIILTFEHAGSGLEARGGELTGFAIAGADQKFVRAFAEIRGGGTIVVHSPQVLEPMAVRYGWADYPVVNLWNKDGLPASPFRTDDFVQ